MINRINMLRYATQRNNIINYSSIRTMNKRFNSNLFNSQREVYKQRNKSLMYYSAATILIVLGTSYAAVPMYRAFCSATGFAGTPMTDPSKYTSDRVIPTVESNVNKRIKVKFSAESSDMLPWKFTPQQKEIKVLPGETALAFYTATNNSPDDIIGIATYNVTPGKVSHI